MILTCWQTHMNFNAEYLNDLLKESEVKAAREYAERCEARRLKHEQFLWSLYEETIAWEQEFTRWIQDTAIYMASERRRRVMDLPAPWNLSTKYRGKFRISTFVTQYRFDAKHFRDAGFTEMPFQRVQQFFAERGIRVENVSDRTKGFGFYVMHQ